MDIEHARLPGSLVWAERLARLLEQRRILRETWLQIHTTAVATGNENLLAWEDQITVEGEELQAWIDIEVMRLAQSAIPPVEFRSTVDAPINSEERDRNARQSKTLRSLLDQQPVGDSDWPA
jgi:hypothetical protein